MSEDKAMARVAAVATAAVAAGMSPTSRKALCRHVQEEEIEIMLSDRLVEGCVLLDKSCPACVTPLLKQIDALEPDLSGDNSLKKGKSHESSKSNKSLTPIDGVPFCVACQAHVVTSMDEIDKVEEQKETLKDMVLTALALEDEPLFVCSETPADREMLTAMDDCYVEEQGYEVIRPEQWRSDPSVRSRISKASPSNRSKNSSTSMVSTTMVSTKSQKSQTKRLNFEVANGGEVEIVRARSSFSNTPKNHGSKTSESIAEPRENKNVEKESESAAVKEAAVEQKVDSLPEEDEHEKEITMTPGLVDKTPEGSTSNSAAGSIAEIDVKKESSVDHEDLTADLLSSNESEDEWLSYEEK